MPIWSSSERPISVRTVWVDGIRHAILSPDDPLVDTELRRRSRASRNKNCSSEYRQPDSGLDRLNSCFADLHVVVGNNRSESKTSSQVYRKFSAPPYPRMSTTTYHTDGESSSDDNAKAKKDSRDRRTAKRDADLCADKSSFKEESRGRPTDSVTDSNPRIIECKQTAGGTLDTFWNPLFQRVLQWLDLSGRVQSHDFGDDSAGSSPRDEERKWSPVKRRVSSRLKRDAFAGRERLTVRNYKLHREENKVTQKKLPKIRYREEGRENDESAGNLLFCDSDREKGCSKTEKDKPGNRVQTQEKVSTVWSPPGRLQLHIVMPSLVCEENASSQESLIND